MVECLDGGWEIFCLELSYLHDFSDNAHYTIYTRNPLSATTYLSRLKELSLLTLEDRRSVFDLVQTFKIVHGLENVSRETWFQLAGGAAQRVTRHTQDPLNLARKYARTDIRRNFFSVRVIDHWNSLPSDIKASTSVSLFKNYVKRSKLDTY